MVESLAEVTASREMLAEVAATDPLTGLCNSREFERVVSLPQSRQFAVLAIDVDMLKFVTTVDGRRALS